eukprot:752208-Hanusia_phi.AAC.2
MYQASPLCFVRPGKKSVSPARPHRAVASEAERPSILESYLHHEFFNTEVEKDRLSGMTLTRFEKVIKNARVVEKVLRDNMLGFKRYASEIQTIFLQSLPASQRPKLYDGTLDFDSYKQAMSRLKGFLTLRKQLNGQSTHKESDLKVTSKDPVGVTTRVENDVYKALMEVLVLEQEPEKKRRKSKEAPDINKQKFLQALVSSCIVDVPPESNTSWSSRRRLSTSEAETLYEDLKLCLGNKMLSEGKIASRICHALSRFLNQTLEGEESKLSADGQGLKTSVETDAVQESKDGDKSNAEVFETTEVAKVSGAQKQSSKVADTWFSSKALSASKTGDSSHLREEFCHHFLALAKKAGLNQHLPQACIRLVETYFCDFSLYSKHMSTNSETIGFDGLVSLLKEWHQIFSPAAFKKSKAEQNHPAKAAGEESEMKIQVLREGGANLFRALQSNGDEAEIDFSSYCNALKGFLKELEGKIPLQTKSESNGGVEEDKTTKPSRVLFPSKRHLIALVVLQDNGVIPKFLTTARAFQVITICSRKSEGKKSSLKAFFARVAKEVRLQEFALNQHRSAWSQLPSVVSWNNSYPLQPEFQARPVLSPWSQKHRIAAVRPRTGIRKILLQQEAFRRQNIQRLLARKEKEQRMLQEEIAKTQEANEKLLMKQLRRQRWTDALHEVTAA